MPKWMECLIVQSKMSLSQYAVYRTAIFIWMAHGLIPLVAMFIWKDTPLPSSGQANPHYIYTYFLGVFIVGQIISSPLIGLIDRDIRSGKLGIKLLLPIDPILSYLSVKIAYLIIGAPVIIASTLGLFYLLSLSGDFNFYRVAVFGISCLLSFVLQFSFHYSLGLLGFWNDKSLALSRLWQSAHFIFSGSFAPIEFFPDFLKNFVYYTPFPYTIAAPVNIATGRTAEQDVISLLAAQLIWCLIFILLRQYLWNRGIKRFRAEGI